VNRSLWLLLRLRSWGWLRARLRDVRTVKGALLVVAGSLCLLPALVLALIAPASLIDAQITVIERFGPLGMFAFCVLNVLLSTGERVVYYSPAEINYLFCGPYRPRQVLLYKMVGGFGGGLLTAGLLTLVFVVHARSALAAFAGLFLALAMLYLFTLAVSLFASMVGALAFDRRRKLLLAALVGLVLFSLAQLGKEALALSPWELLARLERSPAARAVATPFLPFVRAFTAKRLWPDLVGWSAVALAIDAAMVGLVLVLNTSYYEASAAATARMYERLRRERAGAAWAGRGKYRFGLPMLPWWGGVGPIAWRQLTAVARSPGRLLALFFLFAIPVATFLLIVNRSEGLNDPSTAVVAVSVLLAVGLFAPSMIGYDFRPDLGRLEVLKTLPLEPGRLVVGQLVTPALVLTAEEWLALAVIALITRPGPALCAAVVVVLPAFNFLLLEVENLFFLWYPARWVAGNTLDFETMGRQVFLILGKTASAGIVAGVATALGAAAYFVAGRSWAAAVSVACLTVLGFDAAMVPLLARSFVDFDVARERFE
jgi:hypothetical protein